MADGAATLEESKEENFVHVEELEFDLDLENRMMLHVFLEDIRG
jgi:hypothetical protein